MRSRMWRSLTCGSICAAPISSTGLEVVSVERRILRLDSSESMCTRPLSAARGGQGREGVRIDPRSVPGSRAWPRSGSRDVDASRSLRTGRRRTFDRDHILEDVDPLVEALQLALRPPLNAVAAANLLQDGRADAEDLCGGTRAHMTMSPAWAGHLIAVRLQASYCGRVATAACYRSRIHGRRGRRRGAPAASMIGRWKCSVMLSNETCFLDGILRP